MFVCVLLKMYAVKVKYACYINGVISCSLSNEPNRSCEFCARKEVRQSAYFYGLHITK